jgi:Ca2+-binding EF-hand superfamily protein
VFELFDRDKTDAILQEEIGNLFSPSLSLCASLSLSLSNQARIREVFELFDRDKADAILQEDISADMCYSLFYTETPHSFSFSFSLSLSLSLSLSPYHTFIQTLS